MTIEELERIDTTPYEYVEVLDIIAHDFNQMEGYQYTIPLRFIAKDSNNKGVTVTTNSSGLYRFEFYWGDEVRIDKEHIEEWLNADLF